MNLSCGGGGDDSNSGFDNNNNSDPVIPAPKASVLSKPDNNSEYDLEKLITVLRANL